MDPVNDIARHRSLFMAGGEGMGRFWLCHNKVYLTPRQVFIVF